MKEKELRAVWRIEKNGRGGLLAGTAHFFPYRLGKSLEAFIRPARTVLFEGPLDEASMNQVVAKASEGEGAGALYEVLDPAVRREIKKFLGLPGEGSGSLPLLLSIVSRDPDPLREHFRALRPWMAFFEIWAHFLKSKGWRSSVDLEAQQIAARLGKEIRFLETIEEQVAALEGIPPERFVRFLEKIERWEEFARSHARWYLSGDLEAMMASGNEFPSRCPSIVENRDPVLFERMKVFFERGEAIALVGTAHVPGLLKRFLAEGYSASGVGKPE